MIQIYSNPLLLDFVKVALNLPQEEREQIEAFTGEKFDVDGAAVGNFTVVGPKWVAKIDDEPVCLGGFVPQRPGVWRDFMLTTPAAWEKQNWFAVTKACRKLMNWMMSNGAHRLECIVPASRLAYNTRLEDWYGVMGYTREATLWRFLANGSDAVVFSRVRR